MAMHCPKGFALGGLERPGSQGGGFGRSAFGARGLCGRAEIRTRGCIAHRKPVGSHFGDLNRRSGRLLPQSRAKPPLLVLVGPTAVGKTAIAIELALRLGGEVVTADSMQVYRGMDIGTAKPTHSEMRGVAHHLIDVMSPDESFNVARYRDLARAAIAEIHSRGNLPILSGGTGLYVKAVLQEFLFPDTGASRAIREELADFSRSHGPQALHARLAAVDSETASRLHPNDVRRVTRALEVYQRTGIPMSKHVARARATELPYRVARVGLIRDRSRLYERINARVLQQLDQGLLEEVAGLVAAGFLKEGTVASQALGYKEMRAYLAGECTLEEAINRLQQASRRYAKRQLTWFRRQPSTRWFDLDQWENEQEAAEAISLYARGILDFP